MSLRHAFAIFFAAQILLAESAVASVSENLSVGLAGIGPLAPKSAALQNRSQLVKNQWFSVKKNKITSLRVYEDTTGKAPNINTAGLQQLNVVQDLEFNVMDVSADGRFVQIGIDDDVIAETNPGINGDNPVLAWVSADELLDCQVALVDIDGQEMIADMIDDAQVSDYMDTDIASRHGGRAHRKGKKGRGMTYCLRDVRLTATKLVGAANVPRVEVAAHAYSAYLNKGWHRIDYSPGAPLGTACFSDHGRRSKRCHGYCGHSAIKIGPNAWKGAGIKPSPWLPGRSPIGCLAPPTA